MPADRCRTRCTRWRTWCSRATRRLPTSRSRCRSARIVRPISSAAVSTNPAISPTWTICSLRSRSRSGSSRSRSSGTRNRCELLSSEQLVERRKVAVEHRIEPRDLLVQPLREILEYGVRLIGRAIVAHLDQPLERRELVVQANRKVQRVLAAAILVLVDLSFDRRQLRRQLIACGLDLRVRRLREPRG